MVTFVYCIKKYDSLIKKTLKFNNILNHIYTNIFNDYVEELEKFSESLLNAPKECNNHYNDNSQPLFSSGKSNLNPLVSILINQLIDFPLYFKSD